MRKKLIKRILFILPTMLLLSFFTFTLTFMAPADPVVLKLERLNVKADTRTIEKMREEMGLNRPFLVQYGTWLSGAVRGDFGTSYYYGTKVGEEMAKRLPNTLLLAVSTLVLTVIFSLPLGVVAAVRQNKGTDYLFRFISFFGVSMPSFWVGTLLMYLFGVKLRLLPVIGSGSIRHLILPALTLAFWMTSLYIRRIRSSVLEEMNKDYFAGGLSLGHSKHRVIWTQILPNSLLSVITMFGMSIGALLGGATIVESIFEWQGVGKMAVDAISVKDYPIIQGYVLWMALIYTFVNLAVDLSYQLFDPRIRLDGGKR